MVISYQLALMLIAVWQMKLLSAQNSMNTDFVSCVDQQEACECRGDADACQFELHIEDLQTFTSYKLQRDGDVITRGTPGEVYHLTGSGYLTSLDPATPGVMNRPCWTENEITDELRFGWMEWHLYLKLRLCPVDTFATSSEPTHLEHTGITHTLEHRGQMAYLVH